MTVNEIRLGSINGSHGIQGWIKVYSETDPRNAILDYSPWILRKGKQEKVVNLIEGQVTGKRLIASLEGVDSRDLADELIGFDVMVPLAALPSLDDGSYYWHQLEGLRVSNKAGTVFGVVDYLLETGANDVMVVKATTDSVDNEQRLIPYVEEKIVLDVDLAAGVILVDWEPDY